VRVRSGDVSLWLDAPAEACPLAAGVHIRVLAARLRRHVTSELPGAPSPAAQARSRGAIALATIDRVWLAGGEPSAYWSWVAAQRQAAWVLTRGDPSASFVVAAGLGVRSALAPEHRVALRRAGLGHLIAVSGLHVGIAAWALLAVSLRLGGRLGRARALGVLLSWGPLVGYVLLTGASPPAVRAGVMAMGVGLGALLGRPHHGPVLLAATCVLMLVVRPAWALDPGFQLSVVAMASLVRAPAGEGLLRQTWRVTWVILPLSLWHFGHAGIWGLVANLVAVPVFTLWVLPLGLAGWCLVPFCGLVSLAPASWGAQLILDLSHVLSRWPTPPTWAVALGAALSLALGLAMGRRDRRGRLRPRWAWLPPAPVALAVVLVGVWPRNSIAPPQVRWWAAGSPRSPAIVTTMEDGARTLGCVHAVSLSVGRWPGLLDAMGVDAVGLVPRAEPLAPHELALESALRAQRRWAEVSGTCPTAPPIAVVRHALEACRLRSGTRHAMVVEVPEGLRCFVAGRWEPLLSSPSPTVSS